MPRHSRGVYPTDWPEVAEQVKRDAGWKCIRCAHHHSPETGYCLTVHHLDMDPSNNAWWNLLALCQRCHLQIQARVVLEQAWMFEHSQWIKPYVAGYYAHLLGMLEERKAVTRFADRIIQLAQQRVDLVEAA